MGRRFFDRFLYGTSRWNAPVLTLLVFAFAALSWSLSSVARTSAAVVLTAFVGLAAIAAALFYGSRQASMTRALDEQTLLAGAERRVVAQLQEALIQRELPAVSNLRFSATYSPARVGSNVGGDWYDAFELPHGRIMFSIGDVAGHGLQAAATMSRARQAIIAAALQESDPASILTRANATLLSSECAFATAICGYIDAGTLEVRYATAGHPPAILIEAQGEATLLEYEGVPLGVSAGATYRTFDLRATPDSMLVLYTDGLLEYNRNLLEGERRMLSTASEIARTRTADPADAIRNAIFAEYEPQDDVAILTISFRENSVAAADAGERWSVGVRGVRAPFEAEGQ